MRGRMEAMQRGYEARLAANEEELRRLQLEKAALQVRGGPPQWFWGRGCARGCCARTSMGTHGCAADVCCSWDAGQGAGASGAAMEGVNRQA